MKQLVRLQLPVALALLTALPSIWSHAENGTDRGGGDVLVTEDGRVLLADPFLNRQGSLEPISECSGILKDGSQFAPPLRRELRRIGMILVAYGAKEATAEPETNDLPSLCHITTDITRGTSECMPKPATEIRRSQFVETAILSTGARYCLVQKLPGRTAALPMEAGVSSEPIGYTEGPLTFIRQDLYERMSVREQAKFLVHDRMHTLGNLSYGVIADVTNGLESALNLRFAQQTRELRTLEAQEIAPLTTLAQAILQSGMGQPDHGLTVHPNGGGALWGKAKADSQAMIGVGSVIGSGVSVASGTVILGSDVCPEGGGLHVSTGGAILSSSLRGCSNLNGGKAILGPDAEIVGSRLQIKDSKLLDYEAPPALELGRKAKISHSSLAVRRLVLAEGASLVDSHLHSENAATNVAYTVNGLTLELGKAASLSNAGPLKVVQHYNHTGVFVSKGERFPALRIEAGAEIDLSTHKICKAPGNTTSVWRDSGMSPTEHARMFPIVPVYSIHGDTHAASAADLSDRLACMGIPTEPLYDELFELRFLPR